MTGSVWLRVPSDDRVEFEGYLAPGSRRIWHQSDRILIRSGDAGASLVSFNGQSLEPLGSLGEVKEGAWTRPTERT